MSAQISESSVLSVLYGETSDGRRHAPQSGDIVGISLQLIDEMNADLYVFEKEEELDRKTDHRAFMKARTEEISVWTKTIEEQSVRVGTLAVEVEKMKSELFGPDAGDDTFGNVKGLISLINRVQSVHVGINKRSHDIAGGVRVGKDDFDDRADLRHTRDDTATLFTRSMAIGLGEILSDIRKNGDLWWACPHDETQVISTQQPHRSQQQQKKWKKEKGV